MGKLLVLRETADRRGGSIVWACHCDCGWKGSATSRALLHGHKSSCGSYECRGMVPHGHSRNGKHTETYQSWHAMKQRCTNPNSHSYLWYGAAGISFDARWAEFTEFLADMGARPSADHCISRLDHTKNYSKDNCEWGLVADGWRGGC